jgi:hypothetical protein
MPGRESNVASWRSALRELSRNPNSMSNRTLRKLVSKVRSDCGDSRTALVTEAGYAKRLASFVGWNGELVGLLWREVRYGRKNNAHPKELLSSCIQKADMAFDSEIGAPLYSHLLPLIAGEMITSQTRVSQHNTVASECQKYWRSVRGGRDPDGLSRQWKEAVCRYISAFGSLYQCVLTRRSKERTDCGRARIAIGQCGIALLELSCASCKLYFDSAVARRSVASRVPFENPKRTRRRSAHKGI